MKISVIVPVYNVERYLARCLDSILAQSSVPAEIIAVDDGSTDGSAEILKRYADRVKVISQRNGGQSAARNAALTVASGDYVMFVDSDDYLLPHALPTFARVAEESQAPLIVSATFLKDTSQPPTLNPQPPTLNPSWTLRPRSWIRGKKVQYSVWNKLFRRDLVKDRRFLPVKFEDFAYMTEVFCDVEEFAVIEEPLYVYNTNEGGTSTIHSAFGKKKVDYSLVVVKDVLDHARGGSSWSFALAQAADGMSSTISKVYKSHDAALVAYFLSESAALRAAYPELFGRLTLKAKFRLWRLHGALNEKLRFEGPDRRESPQAMP